MSWFSSAVDKVGNTIGRVGKDIVRNTRNLSPVSAALYGMNKDAYMTDYQKNAAKRAQEAKQNKLSQQAQWAKNYYGVTDPSQLGKQAGQLRNMAMQTALQSTEDPEAAGIRSQIGTAAASTGRNLASMGVKGGAAAGAIAEAQGRAQQRAAEQLSAKRGQDIERAAGRVGSAVSGIEANRQLALMPTELPKQQKGLLSNILSAVV
jgi:hypothetical protein